MIPPAATPPELFIPTAPPARSLAVRGDSIVMDDLRAKLESEGWQWAVVIAGLNAKPSLMLVPPDKVGDAELMKLVEDVRSGKFGRLSVEHPRLPPSLDESRR